MKAERDIQLEIMLAIGSRPDVRIWRNNAGAARRPGGGPLVRFGLCPGAADLVGLTAFGRFLAIEVKNYKGRQSLEQKTWQAIIEKFRGIYILARSEEDAVAQLEAALCEPSAFAPTKGEPSASKPAAASTPLEPGACWPFEPSGAYVGR